MDLLERTHVVVDLLSGGDIEELAKIKGLDPSVIESWLQGFMEGGITALERMQALESKCKTGKVIPLFGADEYVHELNSEGNAQR